MASQKDPRGPASGKMSFDTKTFQVIVKNDGNIRLFHVPSSIFLASSGHLALDSLGNPSKQLHDLDPDDFNIYLTWLHTGLLATIDDSCTKTEEAELDDVSIKDNEYIGLVNLYILGRKIDEADFVNTVVDAFIAKLREDARHGHLESLPGLHCIGHVYNHIDRARPIAHLIARVYAIDGTRDQLQRLHKQGVGRDFFKDLGLQLVDGRDESSLSHSLRNIINCEFHLHGGEQKCVVDAPSKKRRRVIEDDDSE